MRETRAFPLPSPNVGFGPLVLLMFASDRTIASLHPRHFLLYVGGSRKEGSRTHSCRHRAASGLPRVGRESTDWRKMLDNSWRPFFALFAAAAVHASSLWDSQNQTFDALAQCGVLEYSACAYLPFHRTLTRIIGTLASFRILEKRCAGGHSHGRVSGTVRMPNSHVKNAIRLSLFSSCSALSRSHDASRSWWSSFSSGRPRRPWG